MYLLAQAEFIKKSREIIAGIENVSETMNSSYAKSLVNKIIGTIEVSVKVFFQSQYYLYINKRISINQQRTFIFDLRKKVVRLA